MLEAMRDTAVMKAAYDKLAPEVQQTKYPIGIFCDKTMPEYTEQYRKIQIMAGGIAE
jgi:2-oxoglutarate ferredoxin oxidoreductase subunit beta